MERSTGGGQLPYHYDRMHTSTAPLEHHGKLISSKPPKFKTISRSLSMAIDNYDDVVAAGNGGNSTLIVEKPLIHRAASPVPISSFPQQQSLAPPPASVVMHRTTGADIISPALSARQRSYQLQQQQQQQHSQTSTRTVSPVLSSSGSGSIGLGVRQQRQQPELYVIGTGSLGDNIENRRSLAGGRSSPLDFTDDYTLPPMHTHHTATHPLKKSNLRRTDTIDVQPRSGFQMKKTQSFHMATGGHDAAADAFVFNTAKEQAANGTMSTQRSSSLRSNFLTPGPTSSKDLSRTPSPSRRGNRSLHDPLRRPDSKFNSIIDSQIRHPSLNDDLIDTAEFSSDLLPTSHVSLENDIFADSHSHAKSHMKLSESDMLSIPFPNLNEIRKASGSFEEAYTVGTSSLKKRETKSIRQHSTQSLELNGRPSPTTETAAIATLPTRSTLHLHSVAAATTAVHQFKRGRKHGRSLYLSPATLEELSAQQRPVFLAAAANFQGSNTKQAGLKQAKALYSASVRLKTYRESLNAAKKSKSFISDDICPAAASANNEFIELSSPHRFTAKTIDDVTSSPRLAPSTSPIEKLASFENKPPSDTAFEQVLRPFQHKVLGMQSATKGLHHAAFVGDEAEIERNSERKRKRIVCIVMMVFLCLMSASVFVVIMTLTHASGQSHTQQHSTSFKKTYSYNRDVPVHYNVRQENERLMKETLERGRFGRNYTETAAAAGATSLLTANTAALAVTQRQQQAGYLHPQQQQQLP